MLVRFCSVPFTCTEFLLPVHHKADSLFFVLFAFSLGGWGVGGGNLGSWRGEGRE